MTDFNNNMTIDDDTDLGLGVHVPEDLFTEFHKNKAASGGKGVDIAGGAGGDDEEELEDDPDNPGQQRKKVPAKTDATKTKKPDTSTIQDLIKKSLSDGNNGGDDDPENTDTNGKNDKAKQTTATKPTTGHFQVLYDHFTTELGYEPLSEDGEPIEFDGSEEKYMEFMEKNVNSKAFEVAEDMITEAFSADNNKDNAGTAKDLFRFLSNGGKLQDFIQTRQNDDITKDFLTTEDEAVLTDRSKTTLDRYYTSLGWSRESINKNIKQLETAGILEDTAKDILPEFIKATENRKQQVEQANIANKQRTQQQVKEYNASVFKIIDESKEFMSFNLTPPKEKAKLKEYMYTPTVDIGDGRMVPQFVVDQQKARQNPQFRVFEALTLLNKGIDLTNIKNKETLKANKGLKEKLEAAASGKKLEQSGTAGSTTSTEQNQNSKLDFDSLEFL